MPQAVYAVVALLAASTIYEAIFIIATALYANYQSKKLKKKLASLLDVESNARAQTVKQPITARTTIYGQVLVGGPLTFVCSTDNNRYINLLITLAGHEVEEIGAVYFDDEFIPLSDYTAASPQVQGRWLGVAEIWKGRGTAASDATLLNALYHNSNGQWSTAHKQEGCAKLYVRFRYDTRFFASGGLPQIRAVVKGKKVYDPRSTLTAYSNNAALVIRDYLTSAAGVGATTAEIDDEALITAANVCDEYVSVAAQSSTFTAQNLDVPFLQFNYVAGSPGREVTSPGDAYRYSVTFVTAAGETLGSHTRDYPSAQGMGSAWVETAADISTSNPLTLSSIPIGPAGVTARNIYRTARGAAYLNTNFRQVGTLNNNTSNTFVDTTLDVDLVNTIPQSDSTAPVGIAVASRKFFTGDRVRVSTTGTLPGGLAAATDYYYICAADGQLDSLATSRANALAGTAIALTSSGSGTHTITRMAEARYACDGAVASDTAPKDVLGSMLTAIAGTLQNIGGKWTLLAGAYRTPSITVTEDDLDGPVQVTARSGRRSLFNRVKGVFVDPANGWQPTDFPPVTNATYLSEDSDEPVYQDIELPWTTSVSSAQRIAKIHLEQARQQITVQLPCKLTVMRVQAGNVVRVTNTRMGWTAKPFEVTSFEFVQRGSGTQSRLGVDLFLRETASSVYDWNDGEETTVDPAPDTDLPNPFDIEPPGAPVITETLYQTRPGTPVKTRLDISWTASPDGFAHHYRVRYLGPNDTNFLSLPDTTTTFAALLDAEPGTYTFRVYAVTAFGAVSDYAETTQEVFGLTTSPATPANLNIASLGGLVVLRWDQATDLDVLVGGAIEFRHSSAASGAQWTSSVSIGEALPGTSTVAVLPLKPGTYLAKFRDSSGNYSSSAASVASSAGSALAYANVMTLTEDTVFTGAKSDTIGVDDVLKLSGETLIDDYGMIDDIVDWDSEGGVVSEGTYTFAGGIDLGSVQNVRLRTVITAAIVNVLNFVDSVADVDAVLDWDGTVNANCDAIVYVRETNDNPSGSPTWSAWQRLDSGEFSARAFQFYVVLRSDNSAFNIHVSQLRVYADQVS